MKRVPPWEKYIKKPIDALNETDNFFCLFAVPFLREKEEDFFLFFSFFSFFNGNLSISVFYSCFQFMKMHLLSY